MTSKTARRAISLNGTWELAFDSDNRGKDARWFTKFPKAVAAPVPGVWETLRPGYDGVGWYRTSFDVKKAWLGRMLRLKFGAVTYFCECWLNGKALGAHEGGFTPFEFDISALALPGANELVVRVINPPMNHEIEGFRAGAPLNQGNLPIGKAGWYYNFGGIWQDVELGVSDPVTVMDCFAKPFLRPQRVELDITIRNHGRTGRYDLACDIAPRKGGGRSYTAARSVRLKRGDNKITLNIAMPGARLWSPDEPFLYVVQVAIAGAGRVLDALTVKFGLREFTIRAGKFLLNGKPVIMKGLLQQGMYPRTLCFPDTPAMARKELMLLKQHGMNFMRAHLKPPNPYYLDLADELGILVEAEPAIGWISNTPETEQRCRTKIQGMIRRDRNHPSVVFWCLMNEAYHFRGFTMPQIKRLTGRLSAEARALDSTRLLMDTSGGGGSGVDGGTSIMLPHTTATADMVDAHAYCPLPLRDKSLTDYRTAGVKGVPLFVSEYGAPETPPRFDRVLAGYTPAERRLGLEDYRLHKDFYESLKSQFRNAGLAPLFKNTEGLIDEVNRVRADEIGLITAAMRANPNLGGLTFCQLADASGELFGVTDVWRNPKPVLKSFAAALKTPLIVPEILPRMLAEGDTATLSAWLVNEQMRGPSYSYTLEIGGRGRKTRRIAGGRIAAKQNVQQLYRGALKGGLAAGRWTVTGTLKRGSKIVSRETMDFTVIAKGAVTAPAVGISDPGGVLRKALDVEAVPFSNNYREKNLPVLLDLRGPLPGAQLVAEVFGQLKKIVQLGGCAVLFEPQPILLYEFLFPTLIRMQPHMRTIDYIKPHPVFGGLPSGGVIGYEYADLHVKHLDRGADVVAAGGKVLSGALSMNMWTRPAAYAWGAALYTVPIGRGEVVVCHFKVLENLGKSATADRMLANLVNYAASRVRKGGEEKLLSRCIDPLSDEDWA